MSFEFTPAPQPFPRWWGPYTPSKGKRSGFRFHGGMLGTWMHVGDLWEFWGVRRSRGVEALERVVRQRWGGGRVLLLPNGLVVKPLQEEEQRGIREYIGRIKGDVVLVTPDGDEFTLRNPDGLRPGGAWHGPRSTGLSCVLQADGSLRCDWYHPDGPGTINQTLQLTPPNAAFANTFRAVRGIHVGAVRVTANGAIITSWQHHGQWRCHYIGHIDVSQWLHLNEWIEPEAIAQPNDFPDLFTDTPFTAAPVPTENHDFDAFDDNENTDFDYPIDPTEDPYEDFFPPPEMDEDEDFDDDENTEDAADADGEQATIAERQDYLSSIDPPIRDVFTPPATSNRQHANAKPDHPSARTGFLNWVINKLKGQS